ncbi:hypothetical protein J3F84DRAFT_389049 [Trichoderma pleuroticola]
MNIDDANHLGVKFGDGDEMAEEDTRWYLSRHRADFIPLVTAALFPLDATKNFHARPAAGSSGSTPASQPCVEVQCEIQ